MSKLLGSLQIKQAEKCEPACEKKKDQGASVTQQVIGNDGTYRALAKLLKQEKMFEKKAFEDYVNNYDDTLKGALKGTLAGGIIGWRLGGKNDGKGALIGAGLGAGTLGGLGFGLDSHQNGIERERHDQEALHEARDFYSQINSAPGVTNKLSPSELNALYAHRATNSPIPPEMQQKLAPFLMKKGYFGFDSSEADVLPKPKNKNELNAIQPSLTASNDFVHISNPKDMSKIDQIARTLTDRRQKEINKFKQPGSALGLLPADSFGVDMYDSILRIDPSSNPILGGLYERPGSPKEHINSQAVSILDRTRSQAKLNELAKAEYEKKNWLMKMITSPKDPDSMLESLPENQRDEYVGPKYVDSRVYAVLGELAKRQHVTKAFTPEGQPKNKPYLAKS